MAPFRLEHFPNVCRICLQHQPDNVLTSVESLHYNHVKMIDVIDELMGPVLPELHHHTPSGICESCYTELIAFLNYRTRLKLVGKFIHALVHLRNDHTVPLENLYRDHQTELLCVLHELNITDTLELVVQDLIDAFKVAQDSMHDAERTEQSTTLPEIQQTTSDDVNASSTPEEFEMFELDEEMLPAETNDRNEDDIAEDSVDVLEAISVAKSAESRSTRTLRSRRQKGEMHHCQHCPFTTHLLKAFKLHTKQHESKEPTQHTCKRCNETFTTKRDLLQHKRSTHRDHMCDTCGLAFDTKFALETHRKRHEPVRPYKCEYCPLEYYTKAEQLLHVRRLHLKAFEVSCTECALTFRTKQMLAQHMKTHTNQRTHTCTVCGFSFKSHTHLNRHTKELHRGVVYECEHCSASYRRKDKLRMHVEKMHNIQTYFVCDICLQSYDTDEKLQEHKAHHQNPKDLQCGVCLGAYKTREEFDHHLCITYRENYVCCERDFRYHFFYNKHMFLTHGQQTNVRVKPADGMLLGQYRAKRKQAERCPKCEQEFPTRQQKKKHMQSCGALEYEVVEVFAPEDNGSVTMGGE
ncbi:zinc finger protein 383-like [Anopheles merus]|uniref:zinc finger protein 383-like n=1 Tax=Anopheles merus TaxID=30066 RepID=UPI001BE3FED2|nr:zinc finger protein 383-like [Anopheles merus]